MVKNLFTTEAQRSQRSLGVLCVSVVAFVLNDPFFLQVVDFCGQ